MQFDMRTLPLLSRYKIINSTVTPRPIAWVTTVSETGVVNAAPHSFFNAVGDDPPMIVLGLLKDGVTGGLKDTATHIMANGEFVINLVSEDHAEAMNLCSANTPRDVSEIEYASIETAPSTAVKPPLIAGAPVSFECKKYAAIDVGRQTVVLGEILVTHIDDRFIVDKDKLYLDTPAMKLIARTHGSGWYVRTSDQFKMERPKYDPERLKK
ncbi:MAG: flavin reductase family protein [Hyphomonadaceae bacterium]